MPTAVEQRNLTSLALNRALKRGAEEEVGRLAEKIKPPSGFRFLIFLTLAVVLDSADWLILTGIGWFLSLILKFVFAPVLFLHGLFANARIRKLHEIAVELQSLILQIRKRIVASTQRYLPGLERGGKIQFFRKPVRLKDLRTFKLKGAVLRNPALKNTLAIGADIFPPFDLFFWRTLGIILIYRDERKTYREVLELLEMYKESKLEEMSIVSEENLEEKENDYPKMPGEVEVPGLDLVT